MIEGVIGLDPNVAAPGLATSLGNASSHEVVTLTLTGNQDCSKGVLGARLLKAFDKPWYETGLGR